MDCNLWLKCLMKCHLQFISQDFCPCYFLPNFSSPIGIDNLKRHSLDWMKNEDTGSAFPKLCVNAYALYRCISSDTSESCFPLPAPDPLWERFDRNQLIASLCEIAYRNRLVPASMENLCAFNPGGEDNELDFAVGNSPEALMGMFESCMSREQVFPSSMDSYDSSDSGEPSHSQIAATQLMKKLTSAVENENKDLAESLLDESFNTDFSQKVVENKFKIWRDAMFITMEKDTKHSEEIMKLLLDCDFICVLGTNMNGFILDRLCHKKKVNDKRLCLIEMLLKSGKINVNAIDDFGRIALHRAKEDKLASLFIRYGADVNKKDYKGTTPCMPIRQKDVSVLPTILKEARTMVDLDGADFEGRTALMNAAIDNQPDVVELLLNAEASVNLSDHLGFTALHHALFTRFDVIICDHFARNAEELKKRKNILAFLFDVKYVEEPYELCDWYVRNKERNERRVKIIEILLRRSDIDVNALSFEKLSPLDLAEGRIPELPSFIKDALKEKGAVLNVFGQRETQSSPFHLDARCKLVLQRFLYELCHRYSFNLPLGLFKKRLLTLIQAFQDQIMSGKDKQGRTALHLIAISFSIMWNVFNWAPYKMVDGKNYPRDLANTIVKELITIGCNVNETDIYGRTPLHYADEILKDSLLFHGADASIKDKDGNIAMGEKQQQSSTKLSHIVEAVINRNDERYFLRLINKQMEIEVQCLDSRIRVSDDNDNRSDCDRLFWLQEVDLKSAPVLLWEEGEYAVRHPLVENITEEVINLMSAIAKEIERLDPRFEIRPEFVGSSNEGTKLGKPDEFDFCFVLTKISELSEVSPSPELPTGFVHLKRKSTKVGETSFFDSFFGKDGILNTEKLNSQFTATLLNAMVNIESQQSFESNLQFPIPGLSGATKIATQIHMIKPQNSASVDFISIDIVPCIHVDGCWPDEAISDVCDDIKTFGCNLVFDRPQELYQYPWVPRSESCVRASFSKAESDMIKQSCDNAREAYMIGKTMVEKLKKRSKYALKNCLLYCIEALTPTSEKASQLGLSLDELESKFHQIDRYLWLKCLMKCYLEFVSQDFCPCYFLPNFSSVFGTTGLKRYFMDWIKEGNISFVEMCGKAYALYRCTTNDTSESCCQLPVPDPLWELFDRNQLITTLFNIAYK